MHEKIENYEYPTLKMSDGLQLDKLSYPRPSMHEKIENYE